MKMKTLLQRGACCALLVALAACNGNGSNSAGATSSINSSGRSNSSSSGSSRSSQFEQLEQLVGQFQFFRLQQFEQQQLGRQRRWAIHQGTGQPVGHCPGHYRAAARRQRQWAGKRNHLHGRYQFLAVIGLFEPAGFHQDRSVEGECGAPAAERGLVARPDGDGDTRQRDIARWPGISHRSRGHRGGGQRGRSLCHSRSALDRARDLCGQCTEYVSGCGQFAQFLDVGRHDLQEQSGDACSRYSTSLSSAPPVRARSARGLQESTPIRYWRTAAPRIISGA